MPYRYTMLFQMTTNPGNLADAIPHSSGWSESHWRSDLVPFTPGSGVFNALMNTRAALLPTRASIVGFRIARYDIDVSSLKPKGTSTGRLQKVGAQASLDVPNLALEVSGASSGANNNRFSIKAIPDDQVSNGEYQPDASFKTRVAQYLSELAFGGWGFIGRDFNAAQPRVLSVNGATLVTSGAIGATLGETVVTFIKVKDTDGKPVVGNFRVLTNPSALTFTLAGIPQGTEVVDSGFARVLTPAFFAYASCSASRIVVRKVGRPFQGYRGRASKRRAA